MKCNVQVVLENLMCSLGVSVIVVDIKGHGSPRRVLRSTCIAFVTYRDKCECLSPESECRPLGQGKGEVPALQHCTDTPPCRLSHAHQSVGKVSECSGADLNKSQIQRTDRVCDHLLLPLRTSNSWIIASRYEDELRLEFKSDRQYNLD